MVKEINVINNSDGTSIIEYSDGSVEYANSDGSGTWVGADNSVSTWDENGKHISWDKNTGLESDVVLKFPIETKTACQLKWAHSTVFLPYETTSSCHRVNHDTIPSDFNFHNTPEKIEARTKMLNGEWPGNGCEYCKFVEDQDGFSDRMMHLEYPNLNAPIELKDNLTNTHVTPRWLEIYFSNLCNLSCLYCTENFSSTWQTENVKYDENFIPSNKAKELKYTDKMFDWLDSNVGHLYNLMVLGGEPFTQPQSDRLLDFLSERKCPNLTLTFFSNLSVDSEKLSKRFNRMQKLKDNGNIKEVHVVASIDCWGEQSEYIRTGLNLDLFEKNFLYLLQQTTCKLNVNMTGTSLSVFTMPALIEKINEWNEVRRVYASMMLVNGSDSIDNIPFNFIGDNNSKVMRMTVFGKRVLDWGFNKSVNLLKTHNDIELIKFKEHLRGILKVILESEESHTDQKNLHEYLTKMDKRRNTDYRKVFPILYNTIKHNNDC